MRKPTPTARIAGALRALANRLDPPPIPFTPAALISNRTVGPQTQIALENVLRQRLHYALHRYSPAEKPAEA